MGSSQTTKLIRGTKSQLLKYFTPTELQLLARHFQDLASRSENPTINREAFLKFFNLPGILGERLFDKFDTKKSGVIDFEEFLMGLGKTVRGSRQEKMRFLFSLCDLTEDGCIHKSELVVLLYNLPKSARIEEISVEKLKLMEKEHEKAKIHKPRSSRDMSITTAELHLQKSPSYKIVQNGDESEISDDQYHYSPAQIDKIAESMINTIPSRGSSSRREIMTYDQFELWVSHNAVVERTFSEVFHEAEWAEPNANRGGRKEGTFCCGSERGKYIQRKVWQDQRPQYYLDKKKIDMEGYLRVGERVVSKKTKKYYVILVGSILYLYKEPRQQIPTKTIFLLGCFVEDQAYNEVLGGHGLRIDHNYPGFQTAFLYTEDRADFQAWQKHIQNATRTYDISVDYEIGNEVGVGKFSRVYRGTNKHTGDEVAIKKIDKSRLTEHEKELLRTEIAILKTLSHPYIVELIELYETKNTTYMILELIEGGELFDYVFDRQRLPEQEVARVVYQLLMTVEYIHKCGIIHRDIKPQNVLVVYDNASGRVGKVKLTDFGLSKMARPNQSISEACGTLTYVAPEILRHSGYRKEVDIWSIGILMYLLITGTLPFNKKDRKETISLILNSEIQFTHPAWQQVTEEGEKMCQYSIGKQFILKLLKKNPNERPKPDELLKDPWFERYAGVTTQRVYDRKKPSSPKRPGSRSPATRVSSNCITMKLQPSEFDQEKLQHQYHESNLDVEKPAENGNQEM